jgi:hypothetical protein
MRELEEAMARQPSEAEVVEPLQAAEEQASQARCADAFGKQPAAANPRANRAHQERSEHGPDDEAAHNHLQPT